MTDGDRNGWWAADPTGRHELRYWDGSEWTAHVSDRGQVSADPLGSSTPTTTSVATDPAPVTAAAPALLRPTPPPPTQGTGVDPRAAGIGAGKPTWWRSLEGLRTALVVLFACTAAASVAVVFAVVNRLGVINDVEAGQIGFDIVQRANDADDAVDLAAGLALVLALGTAVVLIIWQWRCAKNAELLGRDHPRFGPGWSIGAWFIPLANFVIPVLIFQDLWRASSPGARPGEWRKERGSGLVGVWWALFVVSALGTNLIDGDEADTFADLKNQNQVLIAAFAVSTIAAALAIAVVVQLTRRFDERRAETAAA
jgi:hypothetical protein